MPFVNERDKVRAVDYERDIILKNAGKTGGSSTYINIFELLWKGDVVRFFCHIDQIGQVKEDNLYKSIVIYRIYPFTLPTSLQKKETEVKALITEALEVCGLTFRSELAKRVSVEFYDTEAELWKIRKAEGRR